MKGNIWKKIPLKDGDLEMMDNVREDKRNMWLELKYISGRKEGKKVRREKVLNCKKT